MGILFAIGGSGRGVQKFEGGSGDTSHFSSIGAADRGAYLRLLFGLLRASHFAASVEEQSPRFDSSAGTRKVRADATQRRAFPDDRWQRVDLCALHPTGEGPTIIALPNELGTARPISAADYGQRRVGKWLQTFGRPSLISKGFSMQLPSSSESRVRTIGQVTVQLRDIDQSVDAFLAGSLRTCPIRNFVESTPGLASANALAVMPCDLAILKNQSPWATVYSPLVC